MDCPFGMKSKNSCQILYPIIISYMKRIASPGSMHDTGFPGLVHWDDPEHPSMGREVGGGFRMGNTCTPVEDSC